MYQKYGKRLLGLILSGCAIVALSPVYLLIAIAIKLDDPGPVFFRQKRVGIHKTHFEILKFRTMKMNTPKDTPTHLLENPDQYITRVGHILRETSLDELPQIFQIFTGKMSIIGPRPALWNQDDLIRERDRYKANDVRPGLTGWAQINGRDELSIPIKAWYDGEYVNKLSFSTYSPSSRALTSMGSSSRPLICAQPVKPGRMSLAPYLSRSAIKSN